MADTGKPRGTLRQKLEYAAIMGFFGVIWLVPFRLRNRWLAPVCAAYWAACSAIASGLWTI